MIKRRKIDLFTGGLFSALMRLALAVSVTLLAPLSASAHDHDDDDRNDRNWHDNDWCDGGRFDGLQKVYEHLRSGERYHHYHAQPCQLINALLVRYSKQHPDKFCALRSHLENKGITRLCEIDFSDYSTTCGVCTGPSCGTDCNKNGVKDNVELNQNAAQPAETCSSAEQVFSGQTYRGDTKSAKANGVSLGCAGLSNAASPDVYYRFTAASSGTLKLTVTSSEMTPLISVSDHCPGGLFDERACAVPARGKNGQAELRTTISRGATYFIRISGSESRQKGAFILTVDGPAPPPPAARDCDNNNVPDECQPDSDKDGIPESCDNCPDIKNASQADSDGDDVGDACDSCPSDAEKAAPGVCGCGVADVDANDDGTIDCVDTCPNDPGKSAPGVCGCGVPDMDSDGDGVFDCNDHCPANAGKTEPGTCGCAVTDFDSDADGVPDCNDLCPADAGKAAPGICGCGAPDSDADGDGAADCIDACPADGNKTAAGVCGCGVLDTDSDQDGTADCSDSCPVDSAKTSAGVCGCGTADTDSDHDGEADCHDLCPADGQKTAPGTCGCGTADTDSDHDGAADCNDSCSMDPGKTAPGICGCGVSDADSDHDGTADCQDMCPADSGKTAPGACGCGAADMDSDHDGVFDCLDQCPQDGLKSAPGICGCGAADTDSDHDGVADCNDLCAADPAKAEPGICGCGTADTDADHDGTADCNDHCPADGNKTEAGVCGCGVSDADSDHDGTADCQDSCPADGTKTSPGVCGCGAADVDADQDGVFDCNDRCPADGAKSAPGICGCGVADSDLDHDGTADCLDLCPADGAKSAPGVCGCGTPDTDADHDGTPDCHDLCPSDGGKVSAGVCGCGVSDADTDHDGVPNCNDTCSADPGKTAPGVCGCGVSDIDADHDGTPDCNDRCPVNPGKIAPGVCGCGVADTDSDHDGTLDCQDSCPVDSGKTAPGTCGCGVADADNNHDGVLDCICSGTCDPNNRGRDEDGDGVSNCDEIDNHTLVCDKGSFVPRLEPAACTGANGFFDQTNIASIVNHLGVPIWVQVEYRDSAAIVRGQVGFSLGGFLKTDVNINQLGLAANTYGTVCVTTTAPSAGSWSGGITIYKPRYNAQGQVTATYDYALFYPFSNPHKTTATVPLNTNTLGVPAGTLAANWIRLIDGVAGDGVGLSGVINYYNQSGILVMQQPVSLGDGGAFDYAAHEAVGTNAVGMAQFVPSSSSRYYIQATRYFYEGGFTAKQNFYTAFSIPDRPPTGATITARISRQPQETSVIETVNSSTAAATAQYNTFNSSGGQTLHESVTIAAKAAYHRVVDASMLPANSEGSASISGPVESFGAITVIYRMNSSNQLLTAFAPPFAESAGKFQIADFNTFIGNVDTLQVFNSTTTPISADVRVIDYAGNQFTLHLNLGSHASSRSVLPPPLDSYGTIVVDASDLGLIVRNDIERPGQYVIPISGR